MDRQSLEVELSGPADQAAVRLLGSVIERQVDGQIMRAKIVEVEAYHQTDPASHSVTGPNGRAKTMFGPAGHLYVYFTYGMHHCCNITAGVVGEGSGVLVRAVEPISGYDLMVENRSGKTGVVTTNGPGKVCQALAIDRSFDGHDLTKNPIKLYLHQPLPAEDISISPRIGISKATDTMWRFFIKGNPYVSKSVFNKVSVAKVSVGDKS